MTFRNLILVIFGMVLSVSCFSQKEANWWHFGQKVAVNFNSGSPAYSFTSAIHSFECAATVSDSLGNLQFYTNGDTVWDKNNNIMPNGTDLLTLIFQGNVPGITGQTTQGALIVRKPSSNSKYYLFSLGTTYYSLSYYLEYAEIDMTLNSGNGAVYSKNNLLLNDTISEKMTATKHCNNKDIWVVAVNYNNVTTTNNEYLNGSVTFLSYLITANGISIIPVKSNINVKSRFQGQMKFNSSGKILGWADDKGINLFDFNKETGVVSLMKQLPLNLGSSYGFEFSPDDKNIYVNEKQYNIPSNTVTNLLNYSCPSQLQRANDNKIYKVHIPKAEILSVKQDNALYSGSINNAFRLTQITQPNTVGVGCLFDTTFIYDYSANYAGISLSLPNFQSYYFYHPKGEFSYSGICAGTNFDFYLKNNPVTADSVKWVFYDNNQTVIGQTASHIFTSAGSQQVSCIVYNGGNADTTTQCVSVCGYGYSTVPKHITICNGNDTLINAVSPCGGKYTWNTGDTLSGITVKNDGTYILETINSCGTFYDTVKVNVVFCNPEFEFPNVFTPNGDGFNDLFNIKLKNVKTINYQVLNRWGNVVKSVTEEVNILNSWQSYTLWNGEADNGMLSSDGTYFYTATLTDYKNNSIQAKGFLSLFSK